MKNKIIKLKKHSDRRGGLIAIEGGIDLPFEIRRIYYLFDNEHCETRGQHAHRSLKQLIICVHGNCSLKLETTDGVTHFKLNSPDEGLLVEQMTWREIYEVSKDCVVLVLASEHYDEADYIRDYQEFIQAIGECK